APMRRHLPPKAFDFRAIEPVSAIIPGSRAQTADQPCVLHMETGPQRLAAVPFNSRRRDQSASGTLGTMLFLIGVPSAFDVTDDDFFGAGLRLRFGLADLAFSGAGRIGLSS